MSAPNRYLSLTLTFEPVLPAREVAVAWLSEVGFDMFEVQPNGVVAHGPEGQVDLDQTRDLIRQLEAIATTQSHQEWVAEENWNANWEASFDPIDVEGRAMMRAPFHPAPATGLDLVIQPAMSFGTGHHPTTWLMLRALLDEPVEGRSVLDMGSGTGVLGIAAWKRNAQLVCCIDIEQRARENAEDNFQRNGWEGDGDIEILEGDVDLLEGRGPFDLILANINRNVLTAQFPAYDRVAKAGARIWMSGFFPTDIPVLESIGQPLGWRVVEQTHRGDWAAICWEKAGKKG